MFAALSALLWVAVVQATNVTLFDGDTFVVEPGVKPLFSGALSGVDPTFSVGALLGPSDTIDLVVAAPAEISLIAQVTTAPDFGGTLLINPTFNSWIAAGTSFIFPLSGKYGAEQWLSISLDGIPGALDFLATQPKGLLQLGAVVYDPSMTPSVPVPPAVWLFSSGFAFLFLRYRNSGQPERLAA